jgi:hypothetical protein
MTYKALSVLLLIVATFLQGGCMANSMLDELKQGEVTRKERTEAVVFDTVTAPVQIPFYAIYTPYSYVSYTHEKRARNKQIAIRLQEFKDAVAKDPDALIKLLPLWLDATNQGALFEYVKQNNYVSPNTFGYLYSRSLFFPLLYHPECPSELIEKIYTNKDYPCYASLVELMKKHPNTPPQILEKIKTDTNQASKCPPPR